MRTHVIDTLKTWPEVRECLDVFAGDWVFRGQRDAAWRLESTIERATTRLPKQMAEHLVYRDFTRNMHAYLPPFEVPTNLLEIFALMQHHGAPTRLLDFTHSAYVACFFAIENAFDESGNCAVWAIDQQWCKHNGAEVVRRELGPRLSDYKDFRIRASTVPRHRRIRPITLSFDPSVGRSWAIPSARPKEDQLWRPVVRTLMGFNDYG